MSSSGLKAGLVVTYVVALALAMSIIAPSTGGIFCIIVVVAPIGAGALAAYWLTPPRTLDNGAKAGVLAGLITTLAGSIMLMSAAVVDIVFFENPAQATELLWDPTWGQFDDKMFAAIYTLMGYCTVVLVFGAVLGGFSGMITAMIMAAAKSNQDSQPTPES